MIKKIESTLVAIILLCLMFSGCAGNDPKDVKANVNGQQISANEIFEKTGNDAMAFYNSYAEKKVEVSGTVESIKEVYTTILSREVKVCEVALEEGWLVQIIIKDHPEIEKIQIGDSITIQSRMSICDSINGQIVMEDISITGTGSNSVYKDNSIIKKY